MKRDNISAINMKSVWYGRYSSKLEIEFSNWEIFQYLNVPSETYESMMSHFCCFTYFENFIKNLYEYKIIEE